MNEKLKEFIEQNIELIENNDFEELYKLADKTTAFTGRITQVFIDADINLLPHMQHIRSFMYQGCNITSIVIPDNIESIHYVRALSDNSCLQHVSLPNTLTALGYQTFYGCPRLTRIEFRGTLSDFHKIETKISSWAEGSYITEVVCYDGTIDLERGKDYK